MSEPASVNFSTNEQALSTDLNRIGALAGKAVMDSFLALGGGIDNASAPANAVRRGLNASPGAGLNVIIDTGELMRFASGSSVQSAYKLGALLTPWTQPISAADATNPRIDLISVAETSVTTDSTSRNILQLPSRQVVPTNVPTTRTAGLVFTYTAGTPAASPLLPSTPVNTVAIWAVYVPAAAVAILDNNLMDLRFRFQPVALGLAHFIERGLAVAASSLTQLEIASGRAWVNGALLDTTQSSASGTGLSLSPNGATALLASTEYHLYAVVKGCGDPVGKNVADGVVFVLNTNPPTAAGRPQVAFNYRPFFNGPGGGANLPILTTSNALYLGTIHTDAAGSFEVGGGGVALDKQGSYSNVLIDPKGLGFPGLSHGWLRQPSFGFVDTNTVSVGSCAPIIRGQPGLFSGANASFASNLFTGDSRTASVWYYVYLRRNVSPSGSVPAEWSRGRIGSYVLQISSEAPNTGLGKPTPAAGFSSTDYLYVGSFFNGSGNTIVPFSKQGDLCLFTSSPFSQTLTLATGVRQAYTALAPATSRLVLASHWWGATATAAGLFAFNLQIFAQTGNSNALNGLNAVTAHAGGNLTYGGPIGQYVVPVSAGGTPQFEVLASGFSNITGSPTDSVIADGYYENLERLG